MVSTFCQFLVQLEKFRHALAFGYFLGEVVFISECGRFGTNFATAFNISFFSLF